MIPSMILTFNNSNPSVYPDLIIGIIPFSVLIMAMINKDFYNGKSVAKRIHGYQVIDNKTNGPASEMQCMTRNLTMIIWPLEGLIALFNPSRRLGDFIAGTKLIDSDKQDPETILEDMKLLKAGKSYRQLIFVSILFALFFELLSLIPVMIN